MEGWRKMILAGVFGGAILAFPLDPLKADLMKVLILATMGANGVEHIAKQLANGKVRANEAIPRRSIRTVRAVTDSDQAIPGTTPGNDH